MQSTPDVLTVVPSAPAGVSERQPHLLVVLMHGHGSAPQALAPFARSLDVPAVFGFPQGPVAVAAGQHAWWPVDVPARALELATGPRDLFDRDPAGLAAARTHAAGAIAAWRVQWPGVPLVLGGFSQGGMLACELALQPSPWPLDDLAGLVALSASRLAFARWQPPLQQRRLAGLRCLVSHGREDAMLSFSAGEQLMLALRSGGAAVDWLPFDGGHEVPLLVWRRLRRLLRELATPGVPHVTPGL